jgi:predicted ribosomally synthesized peptide with nif11-like leader
MKNEKLRSNIMKNLTPEMIEKAKAAKSAEELLEVAKANGIELTADEAATYFAQLNPKSGELDDDALDGVAGGCGGSTSDYPANGTRVRVINGDKCPKCGATTGTYSFDYGIDDVVCDCGGIITKECKLGVDVELI